MADGNTIEPVEVSLAGPQDRARWDDFVQQNPSANFFHLWGWGEVVTDTYGYETLRYQARRENDIVGVLPVSHVKSQFFGQSFISSAFSVGGGVVAQDWVARTMLARVVREEGAARRVRYVELRTETADLEDWYCKAETYAGFRSELSRDTKDRLASVPRKRRAEVRKALALEAEGRLSIDFNGDIETFYNIYAQSLKELGTPVFPNQFVRNIVNSFQDNVEISIVIGDNAPVAALLSFIFRDRIMPYYVGAVGEARTLRAFDYLYWKLMDRAIERGLSVFDFGRSKMDTPHFAYKKSWGFEATPLEYQYALIKAAEVPNVNPNNPKFRLLTQAWKKLPLPVANIAGPILARHLA